MSAQWNAAKCAMPGLGQARCAVAVAISIKCGNFKGGDAGEMNDTRAKWQSALTALLALTAASGLRCDSPGQRGPQAVSTSQSNARATHLPECYREVVRRLSKVFHVRKISLKVEYLTPAQFSNDQPWIPEGYGAPARKVRVEVYSGGFVFDFEVNDGVYAMPVAPQHIPELYQAAMRALTRGLMREDDLTSPQDFMLPRPSHESVTARIGRCNLEARGAGERRLFDGFAPERETDNDVLRLRRRYAALAELAEDEEDPRRLRGHRRAQADLWLAALPRWVKRTYSS